MTSLAVELYGARIGTLTGTSRSFDFEFAPEALVTYGAGSPVLSVAARTLLPHRRMHRERRQNFFMELLPEGRNLSYLAAQAHVLETDTLALLARYGRDIAGALQIWDPADPSEPRTPRTELVTDAQVAQMLVDVASAPLGNSASGGKTSLAGVQDKIVLAHADGAWHRVLDGYPSTHIVKPTSAEFPTMIFDEEYGARIARRLGLASHETWLHVFDGVPALVIERYDRAASVAGGRVHQEDFNQALGARGNEKYQKFGGKVSLRRIADVLVAHMGRAELRALAQRVVLATALGDLDMHAKNVSLVHRADGTVALAPAYDVVPQTHLNNDGEVALAVDGVYRHTEITAEHLGSEIHGWGVPDAAGLVGETLAQVREAVRSESPVQGSHPALQDDVLHMCDNVASGKPAGA